MNTHQYSGLCEGCRSNKICCFQQYNTLLIPSCPCRLCLIKGICLNPCTPYKDKAHPLFNKHDLITMEGKKIF